MKAKEYILVERCVEDGIMRGLNRAYKYSADEIPTREQIQRYVQECVLNEIAEWFVFEEIKND